MQVFIDLVRFSFAFFCCLRCSLTLDKRLTLRRTTYVKICKFVYVIVMLYFTAHYGGGGMPSGGGGMPSGGGGMPSGGGGIWGGAWRGAWSRENIGKLVKILLRFYPS